MLVGWLVGGWFFCNIHHYVHVLIKSKQFSEDCVCSSFFLDNAPFLLLLYYLFKYLFAVFKCMQPFDRMISMDLGWGVSTRWNSYLSGALSCL